MVVYPSVKFKTMKEREEFAQVSPRLNFIVQDMARWVDAHGFEFVITDVLSDAFEDKRLGRVSASHSEGRAVDVSVRGWPEAFQKKFEQFFEAAYPKDGAFSKRTGKVNLVEIHNNGNGAHAHIQVKK